MKNPFRSAKSGFDSIIGPGQTVHGELKLCGGSTTVVNGTVTGEAITVDASVLRSEDPDTTLIVNGKVQAIRSVDVPNVTVAGTIECDVLRVTGVLALKSGSKISSTVIQYGALVIELGAFVSGALEQIKPHEDEASEIPEGPDEAL